MNQENPSSDRNSANRNPQLVTPETSLPNCARKEEDRYIVIKVMRLGKGRSEKDRNLRVQQKVQEAP